MNQGEEEGIEMLQRTPSKKITGFKETIEPLLKTKYKSRKQTSQNKCNNILDVSKNINNKNFIPSQFPNLTKIKTFKIKKKVRFETKEIKKQKDKNKSTRKKK